MKTHLLDSSEPIIEGRTQTAICGATVSNAAFVFMWDGDGVTNQEDLAEQMRASVYMCRACCKTAKELDRYIYGITDGENAKSGEREAAV